MATSRVAHRYAKAIIEIAREQGSFDQVTEDIRTIRFAINHSADLRSFLATPVIDVHSKARVLESIFQGKIGPITGRFLSLLALKGRTQDLPDIIDAYQHLVDESQNIVAAKVTTAVPLNEAQRVSVEERIKALSGHMVRAEYQVDPALIGGFQVRFEDKMIDASIRHQLERLRESFVGGSLN
jgi:F-type H+-transporting ATPase subunit delta